MIQYLSSPLLTALGIVHTTAQELWPSQYFERHSYDTTTIELRITDETNYSCILTTADNNRSTILFDFYDDDGITLLPITPFLITCYADYVASDIIIACNDKSLWLYKYRDLLFTHDPLDVIRVRMKRAKTKDILGPSYFYPADKVFYAREFYDEEGIEQFQYNFATDCSFQGVICSRELKFARCFQDREKRRAKNSIYYEKGEKIALLSKDCDLIVRDAIGWGLTYKLKKRKREISA